MDRYLVISSDGHAGPPASHYREYLEERYRPAFDEHQAQARHARGDAEGAGHGDNSEFMKDWNDQTDGDGGLLAAYDSDYRNKVLDIEGVAAEVLFPDADVLGTGRIAASPFGRARRRCRQCARARAGGRQGAQPLARRLLQAGPAPAHRRGADPDPLRHRRRGRRDRGGARDRACAG